MILQLCANAVCIKKAKTAKKQNQKKQESMKMRTQWENWWVREKQKMDSKHRDSCIVFMMGLGDRQVCEMFDQK